MQDTPSALDELILFQESQLLKPEIRKSTNELGRLLADEFIEFCSSGDIVNKQQTIAALSEEATTSRELMNVAITHLAPTVILVTYVAIQTGSSKEIPVSSLRSSLWKMKNDQWQMIFHQGTRLARTI